MKIKCKVIVGIVLIAFILSIGIVYGQGSLYSDPQGRFSFNLPAGWKADTPYDPSQAAYFTYSAPQGIIGELIIVLEGTGEVVLDGLGKERIQKGCTVYIPPAIQHNISNTSLQPLRYIYVVSKVRN